MKTMGLTRLYLVNPVRYPDPEALQMAAGASDLLDSVQRCSSLEEAISDCSLVVGASARLRHQPLTELTSRQLGEVVWQHSEQQDADSKQQEIALVFGRERSGLHNEELACCTHQVCIAGNPDYAILNLAQAVQVLAYEIFQASQTAPSLQRPVPRDYPSLAAVQDFEQHLERALDASGMLKGASCKSVARLTTLFRRAHPDVQELGLLRSMISRLEKQGLAYQDRPDPENLHSQKSLSDPKDLPR